MDICSDYFASEEYSEYILREGYFARKSLEPFEDYCILHINDKWMIVSFNITGIRNRNEITYEYLGYSYLPKLYGLSDLVAVNSSGITAVREQPVLGFYGQNTHIAIIDTGINWEHEAFINEDGTSKIELIWDQNTNEIFNNDDINAALRGGRGKIPGDEIGHGTYMAGIAAGKINRVQGFSGVAPLAKLIIVKLKPAKKFLRDIFFVDENVPAYSEADIMRAVAFISDYAEKEGIAVSYVLGMGTSLGSHAGVTPLADYLADEAEKPGRCITLATGNEGNEQLHFSGQIIGDEPQRVEIRVGENEKGFACELWSFAPEVYTVEIISPSGQIINRLPSRSGRSNVLSFLFEDTIVDVYYQLYERTSGQNLVAMRFRRPSQGIWTINVYGRDLNTGQYDIWIMNREFLNSDTYFIVSDPYVTLTNPSNVPECIAVSAYDYRDNSFYLKNGRGFNANDVIKPDFAAPGVDILVPDALSTDGYVRRSGSSIAAAYYAGFAALLQEYGNVRGNILYLQTAVIKNITIAGCVRRQGIIYPNREWGYGAVNLYNSLENLRRE